MKYSKKYIAEVTNESAKPSQKETNENIPNVISIDTVKAEEYVNTATDFTK